MQNIKKIVSLIVLCFTVFSGYGQAEVRDPVLAGLKGTAAALIAGLDIQKKLIEDSYRALGVEEQKWRDKLDVTPDTGITSVHTSALVNAWFLRNKIGTLEGRISTLEATPPFIHRGLKQIKGDLAREKVYLDRVWDDMWFFSNPLVSANLSPRLTGGQGYTYTWSLKLFLRMKRIKSKVEKIEYRIANLNVFTKAFY